MYGAEYRGWGLTETQSLHPGRKSETYSTSRFPENSFWFKIILWNSSKSFQVRHSCPPVRTPLHSPSAPRHLLNRFFYYILYFIVSQSLFGYLLSSFIFDLDLFHHDPPPHSRKLRCSSRFVTKVPIFPIPLFCLHKFLKFGPFFLVIVAFHHYMLRSP